MFSEKVLQSMNYAFVLLCKIQVPSYFRLCDKVGHTSTHSPKISHLVIKGVAICGNSNSTWKADPNGKFTVTNDFGGKANVCFFLACSMAIMAVQQQTWHQRSSRFLLLHQLSKHDPSYQMTAEQQQLINSFQTVFREEYRAKEEAFSSTYKTSRTHRRE